MKSQLTIGIAGESGVGKSTIANIITYYFGQKNTLVLSTDDLHKWERSSPNWNMYTHLNPEANNIELGDLHLIELKKQKFIYRSVYNHKTGAFSPPQKITSKPIIIIEGLHAFYSNVSKKNIELKIFVETEEDLKNHWKIIRDVHERGYTYSEVLKSVEKRKEDTKLIYENQISEADVVIKIKPKNKIKTIGNENENVDITLEINNKTNKNLELFKFIKKFTFFSNIYSNICLDVGSDICLTQDKGGNVSIKVDEKFMIIKASGNKIKNIKNNGFSVLNYYAAKKEILKNNKIEIFSNNIESNNFIKPSMEFGAHILLDRIVLHTHPIYVNVLLCLIDSKEIIKKIFKEFKYTYVPYKTPGSELTKELLKINKLNKIIFLENHGLIVSGKNSEKVKILTKKINIKAKKYIKQQLKENFFSFEEMIRSKIENSPCNKFSFPDAAVFLTETDTNSETFYSQKYIDKISSLLGEIRYLTNENIDILKNLPSEKFRKEI